jgi:Tol biopolymer transport system component
VIGADGSAAVKVAAGGNTDFGCGIQGYSWSPDASHLVLGDGEVAGCYGQVDLATVVRDDSATSRLTSDAGLNEVYPAWSPEGEWIAYRTFGLAEKLEMIRPDGTDRTPLADVVPRHDFYPVWSADGTRLAFDSDSGLIVVDITGGQVRTLFPHEIAGFAWSSDGLRIAFGSESPAGLFVADVASGAVQSLFPEKVTGVAWSPDGTRIAFAGWDPHNQEIYAINADGTNAHPVTDIPADYFTPIWLP